MTRGLRAAAVTGSVRFGAGALLLALLGSGGCAGTPALSGLSDDLPARAELVATPFFPQTEHQCGPAALATVLGAAGVAASPAMLADEVYLPGREGSLQAELAAAIRARGLLAYEVEATPADVYAQVAAGSPVLVLQQLGVGPWPEWHYAVVIGYDRATATVVLRSGTTERLALRADIFEATWQRGGHWALVVLRPGQLPAGADLGRYMQAAAALEAMPDLAAARQSYAAAAGHWPDKALPLLGLGNVAAGSGNWREAEQAYRSALAIDPSQAAALNNRAEALRHLGCPAAASESLRTGMALIAADDPLRPVLAQTQREIAGEAAAPAAVPECTQFTDP